MSGDGASSASARSSLARAAALLLLAVPIVAPLFGIDWFESHEAASYPARVIEVQRCWEGGMPSARWFPDLAGGRGYPFLSFYAPLSFWMAAGLGHLGGPAGFSAAIGLKAVVVLATLLGIAGGYRLAREGLGPTGAFAAAAFWGYAPYHLRDLWTRGDLAEYLALGFLPWALFGMLRLGRRVTPAAAVLAGALGAAAILAHPVVAVFTGLARAAAGLGAGLVRDRSEPGAPGPGRVIAASLGAGAAALALSAFFAAPALAERKWVQLDNLRTGFFDVESHWVALRDLVDVTRAAREFRPGQAEPMTFELGIVLIPVLFAPLVWRRSGARRRRVLALGAVLLLGGVAMTTAASRILYRTIPLLEFVGFPWRFLGPAGLGAALLAGATVDGGVGRLRSRVRVRVLEAAGAAIVAVVTALDLLGPTAELTLQPWMLDPAAYREASFTATVADEYAPIWATGREDIPFRDGVAAAGPARIREIRRGVGRWSFRVESEGSPTIVLQDFFYPGWAGVSDGEPLTIEPRPRSGHAQFRLPAGGGERSVALRLEPTSTRTAWRFVSGAAALAAAWILAAGSVRSGIRRARGTRAERAERAARSGRAARVD